MNGITRLSKKVIRQITEQANYLLKSSLSVKDCVKDNFYVHRHFQTNMCCVDFLVLIVDLTASKYTYMKTIIITYINNTVASKFNCLLMF